MSEPRVPTGPIPTSLIAMAFASHGWEPQDVLVAIVGSAADCTLQVDDPYASAYHAMLLKPNDGSAWANDGSVWAVDLGSTNGTFVVRDGALYRADGPRGLRMQPGDSLRVGRTTIPWAEDGAPR